MAKTCKIITTRKIPMKWTELLQIFKRKYQNTPDNYSSISLMNNTLELLTARVQIEWNHNRRNIHQMVENKYDRFKRKITTWRLHQSNIIQHDYEIIKYVKGAEGYMMGNHKLNIICCADDVVLIADNEVK